MSTCQFPYSSLLDRTNNRDPVYDPSLASEVAIAAAFTAGVLPNYDAQFGREHLQDSFQSYEFIPHRDLLLQDFQSDEFQLDEGKTSQSTARKTSAHCVETRQQDRGRPIPYNLAVRYANRPNGTPLSTIIERASYSTLTSHPSLLSVHRRHPSLRSNNNMTPDYPSRNFDEMALDNILEDTSQEQDMDASLDANKEPEVGPEMSDPALRTATPHIELNFQDCQPPDAALTFQNVENDGNPKGVRGMLRGLFQNVRGSSRHSRSLSSISHRPQGGFRGEGVNDQEFLDYGNAIDDLGSAAKSQSGRPLAHRPVVGDNRLASRGVQPHSALEVEAMTGNQPFSLSSDPPDVKLPTAQICYRRPPFTKFEFESDSVPYIPLPSQLSTSLNDCSVFASSVICSAEQEYVPSGTPTLSDRNRDDLSTRYTSDGVTLLRSNAPSLNEYDQARDASFGSTLSTSYSGTVLGVDLDLQPQLPPIPRSSTLAWFSPEPTDQEDIVSEPTDNKNQKGNAVDSKLTLPHSITSSALQALLPLAAASGIVRPNYATPHLSFYSPSGHLIQVDEESSSANPSHPYKQPTFEPLARPTLLPATTPPSPRARLPSNLRQQRHHCHRHQTHTHSVPQTVVRSDIKGCDGMIRTNSLQPRSGVRRSVSHPNPNPSPKPSKRKHTKHNSLPWNRSRCKSAAVTSVSTPASNITLTRDRKKLQKKRKPAVATTARGSSVSELGPAVGFSLRVCFCQPWDGAGEAGRGCLGDHADDGDSDVDRVQEMVENARVVDRERKVGG
ncbi:uncharacterized protein BDR25DRAFT_354361 [Lindgomyces ingoldianus]|uniref:Uncharacterized protein n=1 Tax=Lindgomyces ingoldianus TaxID=673940 RepID=A0ACB6QYI9_9PLEO|nr:uncharacterized protein BDR25DRAFT_354361 [Lindgomyces ingoldianus]KAF2471857.1 hypothetical protein BDR25DRAFT_354361 [Lindgomyces ingoldianus]